MKINFNKAFKNVDNTDEFIFKKITNEDGSISQQKIPVKINEYWGKFLFDEQGRTLACSKLHSWGVKLFNEGFLDLNEDELKALEDYISNKRIDELKIIKNGEEAMATPTGKKLFLPASRVAQALDCIREARLDYENEENQDQFIEE